MTLLRCFGLGVEEFWFGDTRVAIRLPASIGRDGISIVEHWMPAGEATPLHVHRAEDEAFHVLEGRMRFLVGGLTRFAGPGETLLAPKGVPHQFRVVSPEGARCLTVMRGGDFEALLRGMGRPAEGPGLPPPAPVAAERLAALAEACARHGIDVIGAPLAA